jgi:glyoxylase-like metal-dependent hydrolase (beta-lactamase superfamily II)/rhodanese-related sulfurtransferase
MILKQYYLGCLAHASYLLGDDETGMAAIIDPQRDIDQYLSDADALNLKIRHVFLTHFHADFVAGHVELRDRAGATIHVGAKAKAAYDFERMRNGETLVLGQVQLKFLETPGHTPESVCILVYDLEKSAETPYAALTGDTLFIGDVGRPDLGASEGWAAEDLAALLYDSLHRNLLPKTADVTLVYPAHGAGSLCGKNLSKDTVSTIGAQRQYNYALQPMDKDSFIQLVTMDQPDPPTYFSYDAKLNASEIDSLDHMLQKTHKPLSLDTVLNLAAEGGQLLDARDAVDFEGAHLVDSINIGLGGQYASWAGTLFDVRKPILLITDSGAEEESAMRLGRIGFDNIVGYLDGGMQALADRPDLVQQTKRITAATLAEHLEFEQPPVILDIRAGKEWEEKHIQGSLNIPLNHLEERLDEVPTDCTVVVQCAGGYRSATAASILKRHHLTNVMDLVGGLAAWEAGRLEVVAP